MEQQTIAALAKLGDVVASGIGSIAGSMLAPLRASREAKARVIEAEGAAKALIIHAQAQAEARRILATEDAFVSGEIDMKDAVRQRIEFQERKRQANIEEIVVHAAQQLEGEVVPDIEPDHDWTARFFQEAQDVSSDDLKLLWSRVLAGEVRRSGATSMRALGLLKDIDEGTARLFCRLCSAAVYLTDREGQIFDARVPSLGGDAAHNSIEEFGLGFGLLNRLNEHGLIIADYNSYFTYEVVSKAEASDEIELRHQGALWDWRIRQQDVSRKRVKLHGVAMTIVGRELSRVVTPEPMMEYTKELMAFLRREFDLDMARLEPAKC